MSTSCLFIKHNLGNLKNNFCSKKTSIFVMVLVIRRWGGCAHRLSCSSNTIPLLSFSGAGWLCQSLRFVDLRVQLWEVLSTALQSLAAVRAEWEFFMSWFSFYVLEISA